MYYNHFRAIMVSTLLSTASSLLLMEAPSALPINPETRGSLFCNLHGHPQRHRSGMQNQQQNNFISQEHARIFYCYLSSRRIIQFQSNDELWQQMPGKLSRRRGICLWRDQDPGVGGTAP